MSQKSVNLIYILVEASDRLCLYFLTCLQRSRSGVLYMKSIKLMCTDVLTGPKTCNLLEIEVKQFHYRPGQTLSFPRGWGSQISEQSTHEGGKVGNPTHRPPIRPGNIPGNHFCYRLSRPEGLCKWKIPMTPSGIEPATFRLLAQCINQLRHRVPPLLEINNVNTKRNLNRFPTYLVNNYKKISSPW